MKPVDYHHIEAVQTRRDKFIKYKLEDNFFKLEEQDDPSWKASKKMKGKVKQGIPLRVGKRNTSQASAFSSHPISPPMEHQRSDINQRATFLNLTGPPEIEQLS